ncbi:RES domain-containing protein [Polymorphobacter arshaanensis]|uniref:RES domain-containing protein n=1 Tax=Glacieibacterium arshaanense TaxID=2511025 RepID=A0A4Y9ERV7_9SPHN|nr:RES family NAD+ phosphorylase [Polymorphobacter arshaanensis]TFU06192.1 RES domain-containing protein [Polymorphobacter arshaanensis]
MGNFEASKPEFAAWNSYSRFAKHVRFSGRFVWDDEVRSFLETVLATIRNRDAELKRGSYLYRAQLGVDCVDQTDDDGNWIGENTWGYSASRMKPLTDRAKQGRANPTGIPVLYVGTSKLTAISEVRPWVGADVSVATCKVLRPLRVLDLSVGHGKSSFAGPIFRHLMGGHELTREEKEKAVWIDIDNAFSEPVTTSDDRADYAPTQILAELFRGAGYDAIAYKSHFGDDGERLGYNIAIFDLNAVEVASCAPYRVKSIKVEAESNGNPWFKREE